MNFFYKEGSLRTLAEKDFTLQLFSQKRQTHAVKLNKTERVKLLATDAMSTPLAVADDCTPRFLIHTAFGFMQLPTGQPVGFNGEYCNRHSGMYALGQGYRWYSTILMRFTGPDDVSPFGKGGINGYAYVHNDPVNRFDPDGQSFKFRLDSNLKHRSYNNLSRVTDLGTDQKGAKFGVYEAPGGLLWKRKPKLIINVHGTPESIIIHNRILHPDDLMAWLSSQGISPNNYRNVTLLSCTTGFGHTSFALQLSNISKMNVKAPTGILLASTQQNAESTKFAIGMIREPSIRQLESVPETAQYGVAHRLKTFKPNIKP